MCVTGVLKLHGLIPVVQLGVKGSASSPSHLNVFVEGNFFGGGRRRIFSLFFSSICIGLGQRRYDSSQNITVCIQTSLISHWREFGILPGIFQSILNVYVRAE